MRFFGRKDKNKDSQPKKETVKAPKEQALDNIQEDIQDEQEEKQGFFGRLSSGLKKSSDKIGTGITDVFTKGKIDEEQLEALEELLITADIGPATSAKLVDALRQQKVDKEASAEEIKYLLADEIVKILEPVARPLNTDAPDEGGPKTLMICGVNGVGKTTTIGKLAHYMAHEQGKSIVLAAGDTFRAAAIEQLDIWAERAKATIVKDKLGADPAALAFRGYEEAKAQNADILMIDTAGRLHTKKNLMEELGKIVRVIKKHNENAPHETILILDATTGQNAHAQVEQFDKMVKLTGLVITKLDGSAKGGVVVSLADSFKLPIYAIGVGESLEDLQPFEAEAFAKSLVGL